MEHIGPGKMQSRNVLKLPSLLDMMFSLFSTGDGAPARQQLYPPTKNMDSLLHAYQMEKEVQGLMRSIRLTKVNFSLVTDVFSFEYINTIT